MQWAYYIYCNHCKRTIPCRLAAGTDGSMSKVAPEVAYAPEETPVQAAPEADDDDPIEARKMIRYPSEFSFYGGGTGHNETEFAAEWNRVMHEEPSKAAVHSAMAHVDAQRRRDALAQLHKRKMVKNNAYVTLKLIVQSREGETIYLMQNVAVSIYLNALLRRIHARTGLTSKLKLLWVDEGGETIALDNQKKCSSSSTRPAPYAELMQHAHPAPHSPSRVRGVGAGR